MTHYERLSASVDFIENRQRIAPDPYKQAQHLFGSIASVDDIIIENK